MSLHPPYLGAMASPGTDDFWYNGLPTPEGSSGSSELVDSPLADSEAALKFEDGAHSQDSKPSSPKRTSKTSGPKPTANKSKSTDTKGSPAFRFVVVDHPNKLRDRQEMRENRMHVMHDYLNKERRRPGSLDTRVNGAARTNRRQKQFDAPTAAKAKTSTPLSANVFKLDTSRLSPPDSQEGASDCSSEHDPSEKSAKRSSPMSRTKSGANGEPAALIRRVYNPPNDDDVRLVSGIGGRWEFSAYMRATPQDIPVGPKGSSLEPFGTWPALIDPTLDVNALKWSCSQRFGSDNLAKNWIPALLRARHAFLSTLCISSSHDAIMSRALAPPNIQTSYKSIQRWKVKRDVIALLGEIMRDPELQIADETMVSVVHLLVSDIMGCDDRDLKIHQDGLQIMATARGGLDRLGIGGELAAIMTIMTHLIAVLREVQPHQDFIDYAHKYDHVIPEDNQPLPESPIYCAPSGFHTIHRVVPPGSDIHELLDAIRILTDKFYIENTQSAINLSKYHLPANFWEHCDESVTTLSNRIFAFQPARDKEFNDMNERYTYEAIRLTALVYAHALSNRIPISKAAAELSRRDTATASPGGRKQSDPPNAETSPSMASQIKYALVRTDISYCWDHMGGVLYWVALVAGAAANPGPFAVEERYGEEEDTRKFLAAIAVRCTVTLGFQYGPAILETLKRLVAIETALMKPEPGTEAFALPTEDIWTATTPASCAYDGRMFGPLEAGEAAQKGFPDFVQDFLST